MKSESLSWVSRVLCLSNLSLISPRCTPRMNNTITHLIMFFPTSKHLVHLWLSCWQIPHSLRLYSKSLLVYHRWKCPLLIPLRKCCQLPYLCLLISSSICPAPAQTMSPRRAVTLPPSSCRLQYRHKLGTEQALVFVEYMTLILVLSLGFHIYLVSDSSYLRYKRLTAWMPNLR